MTKEEKQQKQEERRLQQVPKPRSYTVKGPLGVLQPVKAKFTLDSVSLSTVLNGKNVSCIFTFGTSYVERKVRMYGRVVRDRKSKKPVVVQVPLPSTTAVLNVGGKKFTAVSHCKPPDKWNRRTGMKLALRHLFQQVEVRNQFPPNENDYLCLIKVFLTKPKKMKQQQLEKVAAKKGV